MKKIKMIIIFCCSFFLIDYLFTFFLQKKINFYEINYPSLDHRVSNQYFHHSFAQNVNTKDIWGSYEYEFITNSLGFKDKSNRKISKKSNIKRIIFIGDSFTEGIGYKYEDTFVGLIDNKFENMQKEVLNAGVASQSPILYYLKIKYLIEKMKIDFDELIVFLDISDIPDEVYYKNSYDNTVKKNNNYYELEKKIGVFLSRSFSSILLYNLVGEYLHQLKEYIQLRLNASKEFQISFFKIKNNQINFYKSINVERGNWTHNEKLWEKHGKKGRDLAKINLENLLDICKKNNIAMSLVIYPWPNQIYYNSNPLNHRVFWENWSKNNSINFYDFFNYFDLNNKEQVISEYFIAGDIHWNQNGHKYISKLFIKEYLKKN
ncbi:MAG: hypothetical protein CFH18_00466 [Alphaproteobacteria bacterium MarineAlpha5_Bin8]|nr:MAG: hypothetical protein CFH17_00644 [Alphaproteobacteria bacterium MarineAlpha5_Bin7]PPR47074.1 MAG: hypothetical protein CFH18_00466 [Alphaproteobacteria bacterium MarineAlpha5_Bin8]PPR54241.1 MAG: hypothetical protein CFH16_00558 [Alphaproteobacteria bacterium MarineAlpha5_Bin6]|tara:strand:+ start:5198 stop:6325 length:1128 start_codon:yes stop_codon:yes gene_type:complete